MILNSIERVWRITKTKQKEERKNNQRAWKKMFATFDGRDTLYAMLQVFFFSVYSLCFYYNFSKQSAMYVDCRCILYCNQDVVDSGHSLAIGLDKI